MACCRLQHVDVFLALLLSPNMSQRFQSEFPQTHFEHAQVSFCPTIEKLLKAL